MRNIATINIAADQENDGRRVRAPRHPTIVRRPETVLERWGKYGEEHNAPQPYYEYKEFAERFLAWLRARREYSNNALHKYLCELRKLLLFLAEKGKRPEEYNMDLHLEAIAQKILREPAVAKLIAKFLWETTDDERYEKLYYKIRVHKKRKHLPHILTQEQIQRLIGAASRYGFDVKVLIELLYESGARIGEILQLRVRDISFDAYGARLVIRRSKSQERVVRVVMFAADLARLVENRDPGEYVFLRNYNTYLKYVTMAWKEAGLPPVHRKFHIFRHTRASELYGKLSEKEMMYIFGWDSREYIDVYAHLKPQQIEQHYLELVGAKKGERRKAMPKKCSRCGQVNPPTAKYCSRCGFPLDPEETASLAAIIRALDFIRSSDLTGLVSALEEFNKYNEERRRSILQNVLKGGRHEV